MKLYVVRHGIAIDREDPKCPPEDERYLTPQGRVKTREVARGLASLRVRPEIWMTSPLTRAVQTAEIVARVLGEPAASIHRSASLGPGGSPVAVLREIERLGGKDAIVFGHAPQLDDLVAFAAGAGSSVTSLRKSGVACVALERVAPPDGVVSWVMTPSILRRLGRP